MSVYKHAHRILRFVKPPDNTRLCEPKLLSNSGLLRLPPLDNILRKNLHTTNRQNDLMEFFDNEKNWGELEVRVGRAWKLDELRIKSNTDLHKLWYVLLKERNMLMTMAHECDMELKPMPNPERLDKVDISMENLETVVRERNRAYYQLETGETGERPIGKATNCFGLPYKFYMNQHLIEKKHNEEFLKEEAIMQNWKEDEEYVRRFVKLYKEKKRKQANFQKTQDFKYVCELFKRFPDMDLESVKEEFPDVDIEKARQHPRARGHRENFF